MFIHLSEFHFDFIHPSVYCVLFFSFELLQLVARFHIMVCGVIHSCLLMFIFCIANITYKTRFYHILFRTHVKDQLCISQCLCNSKEIINLNIQSVKSLELLWIKYRDILFFNGLVLLKNILSYTNYFNIICQNYILI